MRYSYRVAPGGRRVKVAEAPPKPAPGSRVADILAWVGDDVPRAFEAYHDEVEHAGSRARSTLLAKLEGITTDG